MKLRRTSLALLVVGVFFGSPARLHAQVAAERKAAAEALFEEGLSLLRASQVAEACARLEQSQTLERAIGTMLYLAECYEHLGRTASAWALFREASAAARQERQHERVQIADERAERLAPRLAKLTVRSAGGLDPLTLEIAVDGVKQPPGLLGMAIPVDPGAHRVEARAPGRTSWSTEVRVAPEQLTAVLVPVLAPEPPLVATEAAPESGKAAAVSPALSSHRSEPAQTRREDKRSARTKYLSIGLGAAGVGAAAAGAYFGVRAIAKNHDAKAYCPGGGAMCTDTLGVSLTHEAQRAARSANALIIGGAALAASGLVIYLIRPGDRARSIAITGGGPLLSLRGAF